MFTDAAQADCVVYFVLQKLFRKKCKALSASIMPYSYLGSVLIATPAHNHFGQERALPRNDANVNASVRICGEASRVVPWTLQQPDVPFSTTAAEAPRSCGRGRIFPLRHALLVLNSSLWLHLKVLF